VPALIKIDQELLEVGHRRGLDPADEIHSVSHQPKTLAPLLRLASHDLDGRETLRPLTCRQLETQNPQADPP
jgi:hypothetical protein